MVFVVPRSLSMAALLVSLGCGPQVELGETEGGSSSGDAESSTGSPVTTTTSSSSSPPGSSTSGPGPDTAPPDVTTAVDDSTSVGVTSDTGDAESSTGTTTGHVPRCNDGSVDPGEQCDGENLDGWTCEGLGLDGGELACNPASCTFDTDECNPARPGCGNGMVDPGEQCDGADLQGFDCASLGLGGGTLACDPITCTFDTSMCIGGGFGTSG